MTKSNSLVEFEVGDPINIPDHLHPLIIEKIWNSSSRDERWVDYVGHIKGIPEEVCFTGMLFPDGTWKCVFYNQQLDIDTIPALAPKFYTIGLPLDFVFNGIRFEKQKECRFVTNLVSIPNSRDFRGTYAEYVSTDDVNTIISVEVFRTTGNGNIVETTIWIGQEIYNDLRSVFGLPKKDSEKGE